MSVFPMLKKIYKNKLDGNPFNKYYKAIKIYGMNNLTDFKLLQ